MEKDWWKRYLSEDGRVLDLSGTELTSLEDITLPQGLQKLNLSGTELTSLEGVKLPQGLQELDLCRTNLTSLEGITLPQGLQELYLSDTKLTSLEGITLPQGLMKLDLSRTELTSLEGVTLPPGLQELILTRTNLTSLEGITLPQGLQTLYLSYTKLRSLEGIMLPLGLQRLFLNGTSLTSLEGITLPQGLKWLSLEDTLLTRLPEAIRGLKALERLNLSELELEVLPDWLPELGLPFTRMRYSDGIRLKNTTVEGVDMSIFYQSQEDILRWFEERKKQGDAPLNEIKVVFLGNGDVGKTHTIARLMNDGAKPDESFTGESTPGIAIDHKTYRIDGQDIQVHFWDFGGQDILFPMHRMFMTERTIYVVMVDARSESRGSQAREWLDTVNSFASEAPVMLVVNKLDQNPGATLDERGLRDAYPNLKEIVFMSAKKLGKQAFNKTFTAKLRELILKSDVPKMKWPKNWKRVKDALRDMDKPYIRGEQYTEICRDCDAEKDGVTVLNWCNDLGVCFCRQDDELKDYVILNPNWITNAIYTIIFNKRETVHNGLISHKEIFGILNSDSSKKVHREISYPWGDMRYILDVVRKFDLSYPVDPKNEFFPILCSENSTKVVPEYANTADTLEFHMKFGYLPNNVIHRLMVDRYAELDPDNVWLTGARFRQPDTGLSAVVKIEDKDKVMKLYVRSDNPLHAPNTYLSVISGSIDRICHDLKLPQPKKRLVYKCGGKRAVFDYERLLKMYARKKETEYSDELDMDVPIVDILNQFAPDEITEQERLVWELVQLCADMQADKHYWNTKENTRNTYLRNGLEHMGYTVKDQTLRGIGGGGSSEGELDLDIRKFPAIPWTICEALRVEGVEKVDWNDHLNRLLKNYNPNGLGFLVLLTYVDDVRDRFMEIVKDFKDHIRIHAPEGFRVIESSFHYYSAEPWKNYQYIRTTRCDYDCGGYRPTVYHIFVRMGE